MFRTPIEPQCRPSMILYFSDNAREGFEELLSSRLPNIPKVTNVLYCSPLVLITLQLGMIGASTPFFNGRPFSLFYNGRWHSTGAVGVRIYTKPINMKYTIPSGFKPIAPPMMVTE